MAASTALGSRAKRLVPHLPAAGKPWTGNAPLPGGDMPDGDFDGFLAGFRARFPFLSPELSRRLARAYGTRADCLLDGCRSMADLGPWFGGDLHQRELDYLTREEWAETAEDILWRRSKLGLHVPAGTARALDDALALEVPVAQ